MKDMTAALIIENKKLLLVHNTKHNGLRLEPPGGKRYDDESLESCVVREVREELGIKIRPIRLFGIYGTNSPEGDFIVYMYLAEIVTGEIKLVESDKISNYGWYSIKDMEEFERQGVLVPNLCSALDDLRKYFN